MLSGKPRRDFFFADARPRQAEAHVSRERRWGSDGACLEGVSAFSHDPIGYRGGINLYEYVEMRHLGEPIQVDWSLAGATQEKRFGAFLVI